LQVNAIIRYWHTLIVKTKAATSRPFNLAKLFQWWILTAQAIIAERSAHRRIAKDSIGVVFRYEVIKTWILLQTVRSKRGILDEVARPINEIGLSHYKHGFILWENRKTSGRITKPWI